MDAKALYFKRWRQARMQPYTPRRATEDIFTSFDAAFDAAVKGAMHCSRTTRHRVIPQLRADHTWELIDYGPLAVLETEQGI